MESQKYILNIEGTVMGDYLEGYIKLTGRIKEMINRGGESISATEIERLITRNSDVAAVAVIAMPDPLMGERVCAYIQSRAGAQLTFEGVIDFLKAQKASVLQLPERIEFIDSIPLTAAEKINKNALKDDVLKKLKEEGKIDGGQGSRKLKTNPPHERRVNIEFRTRNVE